MPFENVLIIVYVWNPLRFGLARFAYHFQTLAGVSNPIGDKVFYVFDKYDCS